MLQDAGDLPGGYLTLGDCGFPVTFTWLEAFSPILGLQLTWPEPVNAYREDLQTFQAVSDELTDYRQALDEFLKDRV